MRPARALATARRRAGLTQRELAARAAIPQSTVGRIEAGLIDPRASTLERLLRACGYELDVQPRLGMGIDRSLIRQMLERTPRERIEHAAGAAEEISRMRGRIRRRTS